MVECLITMEQEKTRVVKALNETKFKRTKQSEINDLFVELNAITKQVKKLKG